MQRINIPQGVSVALFLTDRLNFPGSNTSKIKAYSYAFYVYVPTLAFPHEAFGNDRLWQIYERFWKKKRIVIKKCMICLFYCSQRSYREINGDKGQMQVYSVLKELKKL